MKKDFQTWNKKKELLHNEKARPFFSEGEVWFCALGLNVGFEQDGRGQSFLRPVIILKKFNKEVFWGIPLTKRKKKGLYYFSFKLKDKTSTAILSQVRLIDGKRLHYRIAKVSSNDLQEIRKRLMQFLT